MEDPEIPPKVQKGAKSGIIFSRCGFTAFATLFGQHHDKDIDSVQHLL